MTPFDWIVVAVVVLSAILAFSQGFLREILSLAGLFAGWSLALWNYRRLAVPLSRSIRSQSIADALAFVLIAVGVMLVFGLAGRLAASLAKRVGLGGLDRLLGAIFGIVRGCALAVLAVLVLAAFLPQTSWLRGSRFAPYLLSVADESSAAAPAGLRVKIERGVATLEHIPPAWLQLDLHSHPGTR